VSDSITTLSPVDGGWHASPNRGPPAATRPETDCVLIGVLSFCVRLDGDLTAKSLFASAPAYPLDEATVARLLSLPGRP